MAPPLIKIDTTSISGLAEKLGQLSGETMSAAVSAAINTVADAGYDLARARMNAGINVTDQYMRDKMKVVHASPGNTRATITAGGDLTGLSHYDPVQLPGVPGHRGRAVSVTVTRGASKVVKSKRVFVMPGKVDSEGNPMVFRRLEGTTKSGKSRLQRALGPAVYQLFSYQLPTLVPEIEEALANELADSAEREIQKVFLT